MVTRAAAHLLKLAPHLRRSRSWFLRMSTLRYIRSWSELSHGRRRASDSAQVIPTATGFNFYADDVVMTM